MFEKEAEEYTDKHVIPIQQVSETDLYYAFQDGAEFGYNKALERNCTSRTKGELGMTEEQIKQKAIKASDKKCVKGCSKYYRYGFQDGYIIGVTEATKELQEEQKEMLQLIQALS